MSYSIVPTTNTTGVRRLHALAGMGWLGTDPDPDTVNELIAAGYDPGTLNTAIAIGATDEQLLALPYPADPITEQNALATLLAQLGGTMAPAGQPANTAATYPAAAQPTTINTSFGLFDLTQQAGWDGMAATITMVQQLVQQVAALAPNAPDVVSNVTQFNSAVGQFASYYSQVTGKSLSPLPLASIPMTLSGLGIFGVDDAIVLAILGIIAAVYAIYQWATTRKAQATATTAQASVQSQAITATQSQANTLNSQAASLLTQANALPVAQAAQAATLRAQAATLQTQANSLISSVAVPTVSPAATSLTTWFQQNMTTVLVVIALIALGPPLIKKL